MVTDHTNRSPGRYRVAPVRDSSLAGPLLWYVSGKRGSVFVVSLAANPPP